jgi:hypothetical protein
MTKYHTLTVVAQPYTELRILVRDHGAEPPPAFLRCAIGATGTVEVRISDGYWVVLGEGYETYSFSLTSADDDITITLTRA